MASNDMDALETANTSRRQASQLRRSLSKRLLVLEEPGPVQSVGFATSLIAGGFAGTSVDVALFPIDTIKVRLQSPVGFVKAGGFRGIYNGLGAAAIGSAPGAALFFSTYEFVKPRLLEWNRQYAHDSQDGINWRRLGPSICHMIAASTGEVAACLVRVPTEVLKAKMQTSEPPLSLRNTFRMVLNEGYAGSSWLVQYTGGLYRGFGMTLFREIPFAMIQFPLYEQFKQWLEVYWQRHNSWEDSTSLHLSQLPNVTPLQSAACGSLSGAIAGAITTPLDVLKTRTQLGKDRDGVPYRGVSDVLRRLLRTEGSSALWSGIQPRVLWISIGGFVFFGAYETARTALGPVLR